MVTYRSRGLARFGGVGLGSSSSFFGGGAGLFGGSFGSRLLGLLRLLSGGLLGGRSLCGSSGLLCEAY